MMSIMQSLYYRCRCIQIARYRFLSLKLSRQALIYHHAEEETRSSKYKPSTQQRTRQEYFLAALDT
jgi:hypothetical protein